MNHRPTEATASPLCSLVIPAYNEAAVLEANLERIVEYIDTLEPLYRWEIIVIDDGSSDKTGELADRFARGRPNVRILHHITNFGMGQAFKYALNSSRGDYVLTLDMDLTYAPYHIKALLDKIRETKAKIVIASPYMRGGRISNVPWLRRTLSIWANRFLSFSARGHLSTLTSMVRVYDGRFLRSLSLKSMGMDILPEIIYKSMILRARIEEIPAHLDWGALKAVKGKRRSSMRMFRHMIAVLLSGFLLRPFIFFVLPGTAILIFALYVIGWMFAHFISHYYAITEHSEFFTRASAAISAAYAQSPHTFVVGLLALMLGIQLISLGILSLQSKRYFEEIFYLGTLIHRQGIEEAGPRGLTSGGGTQVDS
jgi:glycosyltransferase involved in cell wall biosynthesis